MPNKIVIRPRARLDIVETASYIGGDNLAAAKRFLRSCDATFDLLAKSPQIGSRYATDNARLVGLRVYPVRLFRKHLVFYLLRREGLEIVGVVHGARDLNTILEAE